MSEHTPTLMTFRDPEMAANVISFRGVASWAQQCCGTVPLLNEVHTALFCILHSSPMGEHCPWLVVGVSPVKCTMHKDIGLVHSSDHGSRVFLGTATWSEDESIANEMVSCSLL